MIGISASASRTAIALMALSALSFTSNAAAASGEYYCTFGKGKIMNGDTAACYSDDGCAYIVKLGADPILDFDQASAPYALARGKIVAIVAPFPALVQKVKRLGGACRIIGMPRRSGAAEGVVAVT